MMLVRRLVGKRTFASSRSQRGAMERFLNQSSKMRQPSAIRALQPLLKVPGMISLGGGMPNPSTFPISTIQIQLKAGGETIQLTAQETEMALQYSQTAGLPELLEILAQLQRSVHNRPSVQANNQICITTGSQDGLYKAFQMVLSEGDSLLAESPTYSGTLALLRPMQCRIFEVPTDQQGIDPKGLKALLDQWPADIKRPKVLYTVPTGSNPTGATTSAERKREIYAICKEHDLLIFEDDPYYFLQFDHKNRVPSYFSMDSDADSRVLRFDSFSKILSSGMRLGFVTGHQTLIERIVLHSQASNLHASGLSQMVCLALLKHWTLDGFLKHCATVADFYRARGDRMLQAVNKHLKSHVEYHPPSAGMFLWMRLKGVVDSSELIKTRAVEKKVLLLPGIEFIPNSANRVSPFVRASFSTATDEQMDEACRRLAELLQK